MLGAVALFLLGIAVVMAPLALLHDPWCVIYAGGLIVVCLFLLGALQ
jgi:hypothetical protein